MAKSMKEREFERLGKTLQANFPSGKTANTTSGKTANTTSGTTANTTSAAKNTTVPKSTYDEMLDDALNMTASYARQGAEQTREVADTVQGGMTQLDTGDKKSFNWDTARQAQIDQATALQVLRTMKLFDTEEYAYNPTSVNLASADYLKELADALPLKRAGAAVQDDYSRALAAMLEEQANQYPETALAWQHMYNNLYAMNEERSPWFWGYADYLLNGGKPSEFDPSAYNDAWDAMTDEELEQEYARLEKQFEGLDWDTLTDKDRYTIDAANAAQYAPEVPYYDAAIDTVNNEIARREELDTLRASIRGDANYDGLSQYVNPGTATTWEEILSGKFYSTYNLDNLQNFFLNNPMTREELENALGTTGAAAANYNGAIYQAYFNMGYDYLTADELADYNALYNAGRFDDAARYLELLRPELLQRRAGVNEQYYRTKAVSDAWSAIGSGAESIAQGVLNIGALPAQLMETALGIDDPYSAAYDFVNAQGWTRDEQKKWLAEQETAEWLKELELFGYEGFMGAADNTARLLAAGFNPTVSLIFAGGQGMSGALKEMAGKDADAAAKLIKAFTSGAYEIITEKIGIDALFDMGKDSALKYFLSEMASELGEETVNTLAEDLTEVALSLIFDYESEIKSVGDLTDDLLDTIYQTAGSTLFMGGGGALNMTRQNKNLVNQVDGNGSWSTLIDMGKAFGDDTAIHRIAEQLDQQQRGGGRLRINQRGAYIRELTEAVGQQNATEIQQVLDEDIAARMAELGTEKQEAKAAAPTVRKLFLGERLSTKDKKAFQWADNAERVLQELYQPSALDEEGVRESARHDEALEYGLAPVATQDEIRAQAEAEEAANMDEYLTEDEIRRQAAEEVTEYSGFPNYTDEEARAFAEQSVREEMSGDTQTGNEAFQQAVEERVQDFMRDVGKYREVVEQLAQERIAKQKETFDSRVDERIAQLIEENWQGYREQAEEEVRAEMGEKPTEEEVRRQAEEEVAGELGIEYINEEEVRRQAAEEFDEELGSEDIIEWNVRRKVAKEVNEEMKGEWDRIVEMAQKNIKKPSDPQSEEYKSWYKADMERISAIGAYDKKIKETVKQRVQERMAQWKEYRAKVEERVQERMAELAQAQAQYDEEFAAKVKSRMTELAGEREANIEKRVQEEMNRRRGGQAFNVKAMEDLSAAKMRMTERTARLGKALGHSGRKTANQAAEPDSAPEEAPTEKAVEAAKTTARQKQETVRDRDLEEKMVAFGDDDGNETKGEFQRVELRDGKLVAIVKQEGADDTSAVDLGSIEGTGSEGMTTILEYAQDAPHAMSPEQINSMLMAYETQGGDAGTFIENYEDAYLAGYTGAGQGAPETGVQAIAFEQGKREAAQDEDSRVQRVKQAKQQTAGEVTWIGKVSEADQVRGKGTANSLQKAMSTLSASQKQAVLLVGEFAKRFKTDVVLYQSDGDDIMELPNGQYSPETNTIYLDVNSGANSAQDIADLTRSGTIGNAMLRYLGHELTHALESGSATGYAAYRQAVRDSLQRRNVSYEALVRSKLQTALNFGQKLTLGGAEAEVIADASEYMLQNTTFIQSAPNGVRSTIVSAIKNFARKVREVFSTLTGGHKESLALRELNRNMLQYVDDLQQKWDIAAEEMVSGVMVGQDAQATAQNAQETAQNAQEAEQDAQEAKQDAQEAEQDAQEAEQTVPVEETGNDIQLSRRDEMSTLDVRQTMSAMQITDGMTETEKDMLTRYKSHLTEMQKLEEQIAVQKAIIDSNDATTDEKAAAKARMKIYDRQRARHNGYLRKAESSNGFARLMVTSQNIVRLLSSDSLENAAEKLQSQIIGIQQQLVAVGKSIEQTKQTMDASTLSAPFNQQEVREEAKRLKNLYSLAMSEQELRNRLSTLYSMQYAMASGAGEEQTTAEQFAGEVRALAYDIYHAQQPGLNQRESINNIMAEIGALNWHALEDSELANRLRKIISDSSGNIQQDAAAIADIMQEAGRAANRAGNVVTGVAKKANEALQAADYYRKLEEQRRLMQLKEEKEAVAEQLKKNSAGQMEAIWKRLDRQKELTELQKQKRKEDAQARKIKADTEKRVSRIRRKTRALSERLVNPTDSRHIPPALQDYINRLLQTFTESALHNFAFTDAEASVLLRDYGYLLGEEDEVGADADIGNIMENITFYADQYEKLRSSVKGNAHRDVTYRSLEGVTLENAIVKEVEKIIDNAYAMVSKLNSTFSTNRHMTFKEFADEATGEILAKPDKGMRSMTATALNDAIVQGNLTPVYLFERLDNKALSDIFSESTDAMRKTNRIVRDAQAFFGSAMQRYHAAEWQNDKPLHMTTEDGDRIELTRGLAMSLYATYKREQTNTLTHTHHLLTGGFEYENAHDIGNGHRGTQGTHRMTERDMNVVTGWLTEEQRACADEIVKYLSTTLAEYGNEATMELYGYKKFSERYYFPFKSARVSSPFKVMDNTSGQKHVTKQGFTHSVKRSAGTPVIIGDFFKTTAEHAYEMAYLAGTAASAEKFGHILNYKIKFDNGKEERYKEVFRRKYGENVSRYVEDFIRDLNGRQPNNNRYTKALDSMTGNFRKTAVMYNMSVIVQQPMSVFRAFAHVNPRHFVNAFTAHPMRTWNEMLRYSGAAIAKDVGGYNVGMGRSGGQYIRGNDSVGDVYGRYDNKLKAFARAATHIIDSNPIADLPQTMDILTWSYIWNAVKNEQAARNPGMDRNSEEFLAMCGKRADDVLMRTQVFDSVLTRSGWMRSTSKTAKSLTAFMAEPTLTANMLIDAFTNKKYTAGQRARVLGSVFLSITMTAAAAALAQMFRRDDDERTALERFAGSFVSNLSESIDPFGMLPFAGEIQEALSGKDITRDEFSNIVSTSKAIKKFFGKVWNGEQITWKDAENAIGGIANIFGIPAKNVSREMRSIYNAATADWTKPSAATLKYTVLDNIDMPTITAVESLIDRDLWDDSNAAYYKRIAKAYAKGDMDKAQELQEYLVNSKGVSEKTIKTQSKSALKAIYMDGELERDEAETILMDVYGETEAEAFWTVEEWQYKTDNGADADYRKYDDLFAAVESGENLKSTIKTYTDNGVTKQTLSSQVTGKYMQQLADLWAEGKKGEYANLLARVLTAYEAMGYSRNEKKKEVERKRDEIIKKSKTN